MTGTPIQNRLDDYGSLLTFIGIAPFANKLIFDFWIAKPLLTGQPEGLVRLRRLVTSTCLRRTKDGIHEDLKLPPRIEKECMVCMDYEDQELYNFFKTKASGFVSVFFSNENMETSHRTSHILPLINILRLICNHGQRLIPPRVQQTWAEKLNQHDLQTMLKSRLAQCYHCDSETIPDDISSEFGCVHVLCVRCANLDEARELSGSQLVCPICNEDQLETSGSEASRGLTYRPSAKVRALIANLLEEQKTNTADASEKPVKR